MDLLREPTIGRDQLEVGLMGRGIAPGLGMGPAWVVGDVLNCSGPPEAIGPDDVEHQLARLKQSFEDTLTELERSALRVEFEFDAELAGIFRAHGMMLRELFASGDFERELRTSLSTAETAVRRVLHRWQQKLEALENPTFRAGR